MNLDEAIAVYLYLKDNTVAWVEPGKSMKDEAWRTIMHYGHKMVEERRLDEQLTNEEK